MTTARRIVRRNLSTAVQSVPALTLLYRWQRDRVRPRFQALIQDPWNQLRYGRDAPRFAERLWIDPAQVSSYQFGIGGSGRVKQGPWPTQDQNSIEHDPIFQACHAHWVLGQDWVETGEVERMELAIRNHGPMKGCRTRTDILRRCARLDEIFDMVQLEGRLRPQAEVEPGTFREHGGVGMHIGERGALIRDANGRHRFAIARILRIPLIPVRVGAVHYSSLPLLPELRRVRSP
jgi:hypothetical protein